MEIKRKKRSSKNFLSALFKKKKKRIVVPVKHEYESGETIRIEQKNIKANPVVKSGIVKKKQGKYNENTKSVIISIVQCVLYIGCVVAVSVFLATSFINMANDVFALKKDNPDLKYSISLSENSTIGSIAEELEENGIIKYAKVFKFYSKLRKDNGVFLTGKFELNASMDYDTIRSTLKYQKVADADVRLTIPEGYTVDQIIDLLVENNIGTRERYVEVINNYDFKYDFLPAMETLDKDRTYRLEGYLFPDTYDFSTSESEETVISKFLSNFKVKFESVYYKKSISNDMSIDDYIILASIIEKEAKNATDYGLISSVFHNRLNSSAFPRLESCATVNYFLEEHADVITEAMTRINNPYNTYLYEGLPPGAICNPGYEAIAYAFYPEKSKTTYYYFVSQNDGTTYYATNLAQHNRNKEIVKKANEAGTGN